MPEDERAAWFIKNRDNKKKGEDGARCFECVGFEEEVSQSAGLEKRHREVGKTLEVYMREQRSMGVKKGKIMQQWKDPLCDGGIQNLLELQHTHTHKLQNTTTDTHTTHTA